MTVGITIYYTTYFPVSQKQTCVCVWVDSTLQKIPKFHFHERGKYCLPTPSIGNWNILYRGKSIYFFLFSEENVLHQMTEKGSAQKIRIIFFFTADSFCRTIAALDLLVKFPQKRNCVSSFVERKVIGPKYSSKRKINGRGRVFSYNTPHTKKLA